MIRRARTFSTPHLLFCLPAKSVSFSSWLFELRLSNPFCAPDHRNRPQLLAKDHRNGIIVVSWSNLLAMQRFATLWGFLWCSRFSPSSHKIHSTQILILCCGPTCLFLGVGGLLCRLILIAFSHQERWKTVCNHKVDHWLKIQIYYTA